MTIKSINSSTCEIQSIVDNIKKVPNAISNSQKDDVRALNDKEKAELERYKNDTFLKKWLTIFVVLFTSLWACSIILFLFLFGFNKISCPENVLIALLTETLATVLGLPYVVTSHFFPNSK